MILLSFTACQSSHVAAPRSAPLPTAAVLNAPAASASPLPPPAASTRAVREVASATPAPSATPPPSPTPWSREVLFRMTDVPPQETLVPVLLTQVAFPPAAPVQSPANSEIIGQSVQGRTIVAQRFGSGARVLLLIGGIHGGWEANTVTLMNQLAAHFSANPGDIPAGLAVVIVPALNPDGLLYDRDIAGRFNANGVDLNRNWGCEWSPQAVFRDQSVNPGARAFSEPETQSMAAYIRTQRPAAVLFYHSAANGVYAGRCPDGGTSGERGSLALEVLYGEAAGYTFGQPFDAYPVTGTAPSWVDGQGIPAADVELASWREAEFERNLRGVQAALVWLGEG